MNEIKIMAEPSSSGDICTFRASIPFIAEESLKCSDVNDAKGSPLLEDLFDIQKISEIHIGHDTIKVKAKGPLDWREVGPAVGKIIRKHLTNGRPLFAEDWRQRLGTGQTFEDSPEQKSFTSPEAKAVLKIINEQVNPSLAAHGGHAKLIDYQDGKVYLSMGGGCQGCSQVDATLKDGIVRLLKQSVPEVKEVIDITDHTSGDNPYYK